MALREVLRIGHPQLRRRANEVERLDDDTLPALVEDMLETMNACDGVGLAAPQIDVPLCIIVFGVDENPRYPDAAPVPRTVLMNPEIAPAGQAVRSEWEGFHARIIQHECDHLDGILYPDRIEEREMFGFIEELQAAGYILPGSAPGIGPAFEPCPSRNDETPRNAGGDALQHAQQQTLVHLPRPLQGLVGAQRDFGGAGHVAHSRHLDGQFLVGQVHRPALRPPAAQRRIRLLALIPRPSQLNNRPSQLLSDRLKTQRNQHLDRLDAAIQSVYLLLSLRGHVADAFRPFDALLPCC